MNMITTRTTDRCLKDVPITPAGCPNRMFVATRVQNVVQYVVLGAGGIDNSDANRVRMHSTEMGFRWRDNVC